jgi:hypothetical protein
MNLALMVVVITAVSCASIPAGISREEALYRVGTNMVATVNTVTPYLS